MRGPVPRPLGRALLLAAASLLASCSRLGLGAPVEPPPGPTVTEVDRGTLLLASGAFDAAETVLREVASSCESGADGRRALLLLAAVRLDPRNPVAHPDSAAAFAVRYLWLPDAESADRPIAENLYLMALDRGANAALRPLALDVPGEIASRFSACDTPAVPIHSRTLPVIPTLGREPLWATEVRLRAQRDSLATRAAQLGDTNEALVERVRELEAELQRILRLLGGPPPGGSRDRPPGPESP